MSQTRIVKCLPLLIGVFIGIVSVIMGKVPYAVAQLSGMTVLGGHTGYLLAALIVAYLNSQKWIKSFVSSSMTIIIATAIYYCLICLFRVFNIGFTEDFSSILEGFIFWSAIGIVCGSLSATAMRLSMCAKSKLFCCGIFITTYTGILIVIYLYYIRVFIRDYSNGYITNGNLTGYIFEIAFAIVLTTVLLVVAMKRTILPIKYKSLK